MEVNRERKANNLFVRIRTNRISKRKKVITKG